MKNGWSSLQPLLDALPCGLVAYDNDDRLALCNRDFLALYAPMADLIVPGQRFEDLLRAAIARGLMPEAVDAEAWIAARLREHADPQGPIVRQMADGRWRRITETRLDDGSTVAFSVDITELMEQRAAADEAQRAQALATRQLRDAIEALPDGFALYGADDRLVAFNERYRQIYAESAPAMNLGARFVDILRHGLNHGQYPQAAGHEDTWLEERLERHRRPGPPLLQELPGNRWMRIDERMTRDGGVAGVRTDVTDLVRREQQLTELNQKLDALNLQLEVMSETDGLTGIANRRHFDRRLAEEWSRLARHGVPLALMLVDVDHFKLYNDRHGHQAGDRCLGDIARLLVACARRPADLVARYGGEEFTLLLPHTDLAGARVQAERCRAAIEREAIPHGRSPVAPHITLSIGVAAVSAGAPREEATLLRAADQALYRAKQGGRNRVEFA